MATAEKFGFDGQVKELQIGKTFKGCRDSSYHTLRYDFKPASVDTQRPGTIKVENKEVTLHVPHLEGVGEVVFKGNKIATSKDCLLIIDHTTGEIVLEKVSQNIRVKKTRAESITKKLPPRQPAPPPPPPPVVETKPPKTSPTHSIQPPKVRPQTTKSPVHKGGPPSGHGSMPLLSFDDNKMTDSSSDSSDNSGSSSSSDSDSDSDHAPPVSQLLSSVVHGDLELSEED